MSNIKGTPHLIATNELSNLCSIHYSMDKSTELLSAPNMDAFIKQTQDGVIIQPQHLYITTDEEIKQGDWIIDNGRLCKGIEDFPATKDCRKIIATTNPQLWTKIVPKGADYESVTNLIPKIPTLFIEQFIKAYNAGSPIKEVLLETTPVEILYKISLNTNGVKTENILKFNNDGCVIIHPVESSMVQKMREYFKTVSPEQLQKEWEKMGYRFVDINEPHPVEEKMYT